MIEIQQKKIILTALNFVGAGEKVCRGKSNYILLPKKIGRELKDELLFQIFEADGYLVAIAKVKKDA